MPQFDHVTGARDATGKVAKDAWKRDVNPDPTDPKGAALKAAMIKAREGERKATRAYEDWHLAQMVEHNLLPKTGWRHVKDSDKAANIEVLFSHAFGNLSYAVVPTEGKRSAGRSNVAKKYAY